MHRTISANRELLPGELLLCASDCALSNRNVTRTERPVTHLRQNKTREISQYKTISDWFVFGVSLNRLTKKSPSLGICWFSSLVIVLRLSPISVIRSSCRFFEASLTVWTMSVKMLNEDTEHPWYSKAPVAMEAALPAWFDQFFFSPASNLIILSKGKMT